MAYRAVRIRPAQHAIGGEPGHTVAGRHQSLGQDHACLGETLPEARGRQNRIEAEATDQHQPNDGAVDFRVRHEPTPLGVNLLEAIWSASLQAQGTADTDQRFAGCGPQPERAALSRVRGHEPHLSGCESYDEEHPIAVLAGLVSSPHGAPR